MSQQGIVNWSQIRDTEKQGTGSKGQSFAGTSPTTGHVAVFDANGNIVDGGAGNITGPTGPTGPTGTTGPTGIAGPTGPGNSLPFSAKGDIIAYTGTTIARVPIGYDGQVLEADSTQAYGVNWKTPSPNANFNSLSVDPASAPSYSNAQSSGDRHLVSDSGYIAVSGDLGSNSQYMVDGTPATGFWQFATVGPITFDFRAPVLITEATIYCWAQNQTDGWSWKGSHDGTNWTTIISVPQTYGYHYPDNNWFVDTSLSSNTAFYRYYQWQLLAGSGAVNFTEFTFKLTSSVAAVPALEVGGLSTFNGNVAFNGTVVLASNTPASSTASGIAGQIAWDSSNVYICIATNTWVRAALTTF